MQFEPFKKIIFVASIIVLLSSSAVQVLLHNKINVQEDFQSIYIIHIFALLLFGASFIIYFITEKEQNSKRNIRNLLKGLPRPLVYFMIPIYIFVFMNFFGLLDSENVTMSAAMKKEGRYYTHNHGTIIIEINEEEYKAIHRKELSNFSSLWILFSYAAILIAYPFKKEESSPE